MKDIGVCVGNAGLLWNMYWHIGILQGLGISGGGVQVHRRLGGMIRNQMHRKDAGQTRKSYRLFEFWV